MIVLDIQQINKIVIDYLDIEPPSIVTFGEYEYRE